MTPVGIAALAVYAPLEEMTAKQIAARSGIRPDVIENRFGLRSKHVAGRDEHCSDMCVSAATILLVENDIDPASIDAVAYFGSNWKDYSVWSASPRVIDRIEAVNAYALELVNVSCGAPVAFKVARDMMRSDDRLNRVLLVAASREEGLLDYTNEKSRFMFNFGAGACAVLLERGLERNEVLESSIVTDGRFANDVRVPGGGTRHPTSRDSIRERLHYLDVDDPVAMKESLDPVTLPNFVRVATEAADRSGYSLAQIDFLAPIHMKRSLHDAILAKFGLDPGQAAYLDEWGHMSAVDPVVGLKLATDAGRVTDNDLVCLLAAGTGYTWGATCVRWGPS